jgi:hypothetical protein
VLRRDVAAVRREWPWLEAPKGFLRRLSPLIGVALLVGGASTTRQAPVSLVALFLAAVAIASSPSGTIRIASRARRWRTIE